MESGGVESVKILISPIRAVDKISVFEKGLFGRLKSDSLTSSLFLFLDTDDVDVDADGLVLRQSHIYSCINDTFSSPSIQDRDMES